MDKYAELRAALDAATPGPWTQGESAAGLCCVWVGGKSEPVRDMGPDCSWIDCNTEPNARYIAACHPGAIHALLSERDALRLVLSYYVFCFEKHDITNTHRAGGFDFTGQIADMARAALAQEEA